MFKTLLTNRIAPKGVYEIIGYFISIVTYIRYKLDKKHQGKNQAKQVLAQRIKDVMKTHLPLS